METPSFTTILPKIGKKVSTFADDFIELGSSVKLSSSVAGTKALRLHEIRQKQLGNVPTGFIIPYRFFDELKDVKGKVSAEDIYHKIKNINLETFESKEIIVRSAASCEDTNTGSCAGIFDSYRCSPDIHSLSKAIFDCWKSTHSERSQFYFEKNKTRLNGYSVIVQSFIKARLSGVLFTESPSNLEDGYRIEYCYGDAEQLVSGKITPTVVRVENDLDSLSLETKVAFEKLISLGKRLQDLFKAPQDIEWAIDQKNKLYILQCRTISVKKYELTLWTRDNMNENYPDVLTPFLASFAKESYFHYYSGLARSFGQGHLVNELYPYFRNTVGFHNGRIYYCLSSLFKIMGSSPMSESLKRSFQGFISNSTNSTKTKSNKGLLLKKLIFVFHVVKKFALISKHTKTFEKTVDDFLTAAGNMSPDAKYFGILRIRFRKWTPYSIVDFFAMLCSGLLEKLIEMIDPKSIEISKTTFLGSLTNVKSSVMDQSLNNLVEKTKPIIGGSEKVSKYSDFYQLLHKAENLDILASWNEFLTNWGFRSSGELTLNNTSYLDDPEQLFILLKHLILEGHVAHQSEKTTALPNKLNTKLIIRTINKSPFYIFNPVFLAAAVYLTHAGIRFRERVRYKQAALYHSLKITLQDLGSVLEEKGMLQNKNDIYFLEFQEIEAIIFGSYQFIETLQSLISGRKNAHFECSQKTPQNQVRKTFYDFHSDQISQPNTNTELTTWHGTCASAGSAKGRAVVIDSILEIKEIQKGDILVVRQTDPGWTPAFSLISGLVVENGGLLSHGAILAREFRIPTVVGLNNITKIIRTGDRIRLDGNRGLVIKET